MIQTNLMHGLLRSENIQHSKVINLKPGQVFQGKVLKLHPDHLATIQMGNVKLHAKLESPLKAETKYWLQVQPNKEMVELKVVHGPSMKNDTGLLNGLKSGNDDLLQKFNIPTTKTNTQLLEQLVQKQIPFTKQDMHTSHNLLSETSNKQKGLTAITTILERNLPLTKEVFKSFIAFQDEKPLAAQLKSIQEKLFPLQENSSSVRQLTNMIEKLSGQTSGTMDLNRTVLSLLKTWVNMNDGKEMQSLLQKIGLIPKGYNQASLMEAMKEVVEPNNRMMNMQEGTNQTKSLPALLAQMEQQTLQSQGSDIGKHLLQAINKGGNTDKVIEVLQRSYTNPSEFGLTTKEHALLKDSQVNGNPALSSLLFDMNKGKEVAQILKNAFNMLGMQFEHDLLQSKSFNELQHLKPLLLHTLQQDAISAPIKEEIQQVVHRLTGQQLLLSNENNPIQQILMQIPFQIGERWSDLTIQWHGKKKESGEIDPDFCRIIFYLELETIKETMVDVQVQNRIINIQLMNDTPFMKELMTKFEPNLKERLSEKQYTLSSVKLIESVSADQQSQPKHSLSSYPAQTYSGVDVRI